MNTKFLSYGPSQSVLQFLDPNIRNQLSQRAPTLRTAEALVPLRVRNLELSEEDTVLNDTTYKLGIVQRQTTNQTSDDVKKQNDDGGLRYDLDKYGDRDSNAENVLTPGDVTLYKKGRNEDQETPQNDVRIVERNDQNDLHEFYIQLTITSPRGVQIERVRYNKWLYAAHKAVRAKLLTRSSGFPVYVKNLDVRYAFMLRLPEGIQFAIRGLKLYYPSQLIGLKPIICESSFPLKFLMAKYLRKKDLSNKVIKKVVNSVDFLVLVGLMGCFHLKTRRLLESTHHFWDPSRSGIVKCWLAKNKEVGTCWTFKHYDECVFRDFLMQILQLDVGAERVDETTVHIPTTNNTVIVVSYGPVDPLSKYKTSLDIQLTMEVVSEEDARSREH